MRIPSSIMVLMISGGLLLPPAIAAPSQEQAIAGIRSLLHNGSPRVAEKKAHAMLRAGKVGNRERRKLLRIIAIAEEMLTSLHEYKDAAKAIAAWKSLLHEFVSPDDAAGIRFKITWLYWKQGDMDSAIRSAEELFRESAGSGKAVEAHLILARINIKRSKPRLARKHLLKYLVDTASDGNQAQGLAWMAVVDFMEQRHKVAYQNILQAIELSPGLVSSDVTLLATYVRLLYERNDGPRFALQSERFFKRYIDRPEARLIRLLHADMLVRKGKAEEAANAYERLSEIAPETSVGMRAFMRKLMLQHAETSKLETLKPVLLALKKLAAKHQLSAIEDEAMLNQALLWSRLSGQVDKAEEKALDLFSRVLVGTTPRFSKTARNRGYELFTRHLQSTLANDNHALQVIVLWRRYPQLRESASTLQGDALKTHHRILLGVARAMRSLMDFAAAEDLLTRLYKQTQDSIAGDRIMLERAQLWLDRGDTGGAARIMRWLETHSFTLYRPEMLLTAAGIKYTAGHPSEASQTLKQIAEQDLAPEMRAGYWRYRALIAEALEQWHRAAAAWGRHLALLEKKTTPALLARADALFHAGDYAEAETAYQLLPEGDRDARWQYQVAVSERYNGKWRQAGERLTALLENADAGEYALRARLLLAEHQASSLMEKM